MADAFHVAAKRSAPKTFLGRTWRWVRWPLLVLAILYAALFIYWYPRLQERDRSEKTVTLIHAQRITLADVMGNYLPPAPDQKLNDSTLAGIDANKNGIRDDVELAIFRLHPDSARIRAAELQYAMELQNELGNIFDTQTFIAATQEEERGSLCVIETGPKVRASDPQDQINKAFAIGEARQKEVEDLVFNNSERKAESEQNAQKYMTSYASNLKGNECDVNFSARPN